jgi:hypothetical protein
MTAAGRHGGRRPRVRVRTVAVSGAVLVALAVVGVGTASATGGAWTRQGSPRHTGPYPSATSTSSPSAAAQAGSGAPTAAAAEYAPPPANAPFDYQINEPYDPPAGVRVVSRDHDASPASGRYNICYVNGFQTQSEAANWWKTNHSDLLLRHNGKLVTDDDWNEIMLDITTAAKRTALAEIVNGWIDQCADKKYQAVEIDNLDTYTRADGALTQAQAVAYVTLLVSHAHGKGLAAAQKNTAELADTGRSKIGFDFAIAEECANWNECQDYVDVYRDHVIVIEYDSTNYKKACNGYGATLSIVRRDRDVTAPDSAKYVYQSC